MEIDSGNFKIHLLLSSAFRADPIVRDAGRFQPRQMRLKVIINPSDFAVRISGD
jgi:hypothetical protein